jgi:signal transduction histidine kinase
VPLKTISARLTLLYVFAVGGTMLGIFLLGRYLVQAQLTASLDAALAAKFQEVGDRLSVDNENGRLEAALFYEMGVRTSPFHIEVEDLWNDPAFRTARTQGTPAPRLPPPRFYNEEKPDRAPARVYETYTESLRVRLSGPLAPIREAVAAYTRLGLLVMASVIALSTGAGVWLSRTALRPVRLIETTAQRISADNLAERVPVPAADDEISRLARLLNETFDRLQSSFEQVQRFAGDASHELKTPLSLIRLNIERVALDAQTAPPSREALQDAIEQIHHLDRLIERLLFLSRAQAGEVALDRERFRADEFIREFAHDAELLAQAGGRVFAVIRSDQFTVSADRARLRQVLLNLLSNALRHTPVDGHVELHSVALPDGGWQLRLADEGPGVPADKLEAIFGRFVRLRPPAAESGAAGTGLGLAISRSIVELHRGTIRARNRTDRRGLEFLLNLPPA